MAKAKQLAIKGKTLIDGNGGPVVKDPVILLEGSRIKSIGGKDKVAIPNGVEVIDAGHCTLMPGMMDLHIHLCDVQQPHIQELSRGAVGSDAAAAADVRLFPRADLLRDGLHHAARPRPAKYAGAADPGDVRGARRDRRRRVGRARGSWSAASPT